jgi:hypothetical protein
MAGRKSAYILPGEAVTIDQNEKLRVLAALCRELAELGLNVGMSDAKPAISARFGRLAPRLWISVNPTGEFFEWCRDTRDRHAVADPKGAARQIADHVTAVGRWPFGAPEQRRS